MTRRASQVDAAQTAAARRLPVGAEFIESHGAHVRVWAPRRRSVTLVFEERRPAHELHPEGNGYFSALVPEAKPGDLYRFRLDDDREIYPDPVSRFQPQGPAGPSELINPGAFEWSDDDWIGLTPHGQVIYEMHIGTFTREGTWSAAQRELPALVDLGVTVLNIMPIADFTGRFGWGYDGVNYFAPTRLYGRPDDVRRFIDRAHELKLGVILDVVYNHVGCDGATLSMFAPQYISQRHKSDWGGALNFDGPDSGPVREFVLGNVRHWIEEYHFDGFRFDATQAIIDDSPRHILSEIAEHARAVAGERSVLLVNENEPQNAKFVRPRAAGGFGLDALWNDDFHHSAMVALTGRSEAYYTDCRGTAPEFVAAAKWGFLYQGQRYAWQEQRRGAPALDLPPTAFIHFIQNHDQVANSLDGRRAHELASPALLRAMTALLLLSPQTPMLFQGQEFAASSPFLYFADHDRELAASVRKGRLAELSQFPSLVESSRQEMPDPGAVETFERCKLNHAEHSQARHAMALQMHKDLIALRTSDPVLSRAPLRRCYDGAALSRDVFVLRFFDEPEGDRLLAVNLGPDCDFTPAPEPLLAPPEGQRWAEVWSSEDVRYGGIGAPPLDTEREGWRFPACSAVLMRSRPEAEAIFETRIVTSGHARRDDGS